MKIINTMNGQVIHREPATAKPKLILKATDLIILFFALAFIADGVNQVLISSGSGFTRISIFVRFFGLIIALLLLIQKRRVTRIVEVLLFFYGVYLIGSFAATQNYGDYLWFENFSMVTKMLFFFVVIQVLPVTFTKDPDRKLLFLVFEYLLLIQSIVVIFSFIFKIDMFASYQGGIRFGYDGLIPARNEASAFFLIAFFFFLFKFHHDRFHRDRMNVFKLLIVVLAALLTGTKVVLIIPVILLMYIIREIIRSRDLKVKRQYLLASTLIFLLLALAISQIEFILTQIKPTIDYYSGYITDFDFTTFDIIASGRQIRIQEFVTTYLPNFNLFNYLFGGHDIAANPTESDLIDVFIRLGLLGGLGFYYLYITTMLPKGRPIQITHFLFVLIWLAVSATAGHIVFSAINGGYLAILIFYFLTFADKRELLSSTPLVGFDEPV